MTDDQDSLQCSVWIINAIMSMNITIILDIHSFNNETFFDGAEMTLCMIK
jgi:hypothetical protein